MTTSTAPVDSRELQELPASAAPARLLGVPTPGEFETARSAEAQQQSRA